VNLSFIYEDDLQVFLRQSSFTRHMKILHVFVLVGLASSGVRIELITLLYTILKSVQGPQFRN
jgi:hypothetical protein